MTPEHPSASRLAKEAMQRDRLQDRLARRAPSAPTADFDLIAPNDRQRNADPRAGASREDGEDILDLGRVRDLEGGGVCETLAVPVRGPAGIAETSIFRHGGVWHARRPTPSGRIVMGIGYSRAGAEADLDAQWSMA